MALADALHAAACGPAALLAACRVELLSGGLPDADEPEAAASGAAAAAPRHRWKLDGLHVVTDDAFADAHMLGKLEAAIDGGACAVQLRLKHVPAEEYVGWAWQVKALCLRRGVAFIIDDRVDVALAVDADGVHVGRGDMPAAIARRLLGPHKIVGVSTYGSRAEVAAALRPEVDADYVGSPAVFATSTKPAAASAGVAHLGEMRQWVADELSRRTQGPGGPAPGVVCPVVAIGGIAPANAAACVEAGADGLAVVSALLAPAQPSGVREAAAALCGTLPA